MSMEERVIIQQHQDSEEVILDSPNNPFINHRNRCCFHFPCFSPSPSPSTTTTPRHVTLGGPPTQSSVATSSSSSSSLWDRFRSAPIRAFKKIREWSEIVAGPQWKTFIRRFNRKRHNYHHRHQHQNGKFQYDPLSYALNFDEGPGQNGHFDHQDFLHNGHAQFPDFSSRLAASPKSPSSHLGNGVSSC